MQNNYLYQGAYSELDEDLGWTDFEMRSYDTQIGRFMQADPFDQFASGYIGMGNDPANMVDPSGGIGLPIFCPGTSGLSIFITTAATAIVNANQIAGVGISITGLATNFGQAATL